MAALLIVVVALPACTPSSARHPTGLTQEPTTTPTPTPAPATTGELRAAISRWHRTSATITYHTERQRPGLPESVHQCLRAVVEDRSGVAAALRFCDPNGVVTLVWDPPWRWRLEVEEADTTTTAIVVGHNGILCEQPNGAEASCRPRSLDALLIDVPFRELIVDAASTARGVHLSPGAPITVTTGMVAGVLVRCFDRQSGSSAARWCFAGDGALVSIKLETEGRVPTIIEATRVSHAVDDARFDQLRLGF
jgi:hypothetical protein